MIYTHTGKQVMRDGEHYADAVSPEAAARIAEALTALGELGGWVPVKIDPPFRYETVTYDTVGGITKRVKGTTRTICLGIPHRQGDEYACSCGMRWDVSEGEEHP